MKNEVIKNQIREITEFQVPNLQKQLSLSYTEMKTVLNEMLKEHEIAFVSGVTYKVIDRNAMKDQWSHAKFEPQDDEEAMFIKALWECVKCDDVSPALIQRKCSVGYADAVNAIEWMEENDFVSEYPYRDVLITSEEFLQIFENPDEDDCSEDDEFKRQLDDMHRDLIEHLNKVRNENEDNVTEIDFVDDVDEDDRDDGDDGEEKEKINFRSLLKDCIMWRLEDGKDDETYVLGLEEDIEFKLKFVHDGNKLRISYAGKVVADVNQTERKVKNVLKGYAPVVLDEQGELSIAIENAGGTLMALMKLYAAVLAVKRMK